MPGGFKEEFETYEECAEREFKEETNLDVKVKNLIDVKSHIYNDEIIVVLIYSVECGDLSQIKLDHSHDNYEFVKEKSNKKVIWYLEDNLYSIHKKESSRKITYLLSGINYEKGFNDNQIATLKKDISTDSIITFIPSSLDDYIDNDNRSKKIIDYFNKIDINFRKKNLLDDRIEKTDAKKHIEKSDIIFLLGGNPEKQMCLINFFDIKNDIKEKNGIVIGVSAGAMNLAKKIVYKDELQNETYDYDGIGITEIFIYPHLNIEDKNYLKELLEVSKQNKLYTLNNEAFIKIEDEKKHIDGEYYILGE